MGWLWRTCDCGMELGQPTDVECIVGHVNCIECGERIEICEYERMSAVEDVLDRLDKAESAIEVLKKFTGYGGAVSTMSGVTLDQYRGNL